MTPIEKAAKHFVDKFRSYTGYHEKASNSQLDSFTANSGSNNWNRFAAAIDKLRDQGYNVYNGKKNGYEWCDISFDAVQIECWGVETAQKMLYQPWNSAGAGCEFSANYYRAAGAWIERSGTPKIGDQIFYGKRGSETHTGAVYAVDGTYVYTVEGNYSNQVSERKLYRTDSSIAGYGRPDYNLVAYMFAEPVTPDTPVKDDDEPKPEYVTKDIVDKMIDDVCGKWIKDIRDVPHKSVEAITRTLLDIEAVDGGTPYSVDPDDIRLPYNVLRAIVICVRYVDKRLKEMEDEKDG